jgi:acyl-CoA synthetase (AMP-forming)/AMP-acid ligase II
VLHRLSSSTIAQFGAKPALVAHDRTLSYAELAAATRLAIAALRRAGVAPKDRVAISLGNSASAAVAWLASCEMGAVPVVLPAAIRDPAASAIVSDCNPKVLLTDRAMIESTVVDSVDTEVRAERDLAAIIYTSGTTGEPKGVMLSVGNMAAALAAVHNYLQPQPSDVFFSALPLSSSYGLYQMISALSLGATLVLERSFAFPLQSLRLMQAQRATIFAAVPTQIAWIVASTAAMAPLLQTLRIVTTAAAALPAEHAKRMQQIVPQARIYAMYGQTECKRISYLEPERLFDHTTSVGRGLAIQRHRIVDATGNEVSVGQPGELIVQGPHVMLGYWQKPEATSAKLRDSTDGSGTWLHTGDLFRADAAGYLYFLGRNDEIIKTGGHKVSPREIEDVLLELPQVQEAAVVGREDVVWGEVAIAFVVLGSESSISAEDLLKHCARRLPRYMIPKEVLVRPQLPKTESGKIRKRDLV